MGCDIHLYVERRENGKWVTCDHWEDDEYEPGRKSVNYKKAFYHDRNYDLFAIFADVRNGRGFAGIKTGDGFNPISAPKGIPEDCCPEYRSVAKAYGEDGHSHSWLTVAEIMGFDWTQTTRKTGVVSPLEWAQWKLGEDGPRSWCGSVDGGSIKHVSPDDMETVAKEVTGGDLWSLYHDTGEVSRMVSEKLGGGSIYTRVDWEIPYYKSGSRFLGTVLPRLWRLGAPEEVRLCFFFDN